MGEYPAAVGDEYVAKVCSLLDDKYGFHVFQNSSQAPDAVTIRVGDETIRFDIILDQRRVDITQVPPREKSMYFYCECKHRTNVGDLRFQLQEFLSKALRASPTLQRLYAEDFGFIFVCNKPFGIDQTHLQTVTCIQELLNVGVEQVDAITRLCSRIGILFLTDWLLETTAKGRPMFNGRF